jgi:hypothetical protein|tara:strand:+ start:2955 stop:3113 length:159 start_codon:yes stop_codon:yes gene_type:complete
MIDKYKVLHYELRYGKEYYPVANTETHEEVYASTIRRDAEQFADQLNQMENN